MLTFFDSLILNNIRANKNPIIPIVANTFPPIKIKSDISPKKILQKIFNLEYRKPWMEKAIEKTPNVANRKRHITIREMPPSNSSSG